MKKDFQAKQLWKKAFSKKEVVRPTIMDESSLPWPFPTSKPENNWAWPYPDEEIEASKSAVWPFPEPVKVAEPLFAEELASMSCGGVIGSNYVRVIHLDNPKASSATITHTPYDPKNITYIETDPNGKSLNEAGSKADAGKLRPWLVLGDFSNALEEVAKVGTTGAKKYTAHGWLTVPDGKDRYMDAFGRHMLQLGSGKVYDDGPNGIYTKHLAQMIWNLLAVLELEQREEKG
jgi:hypothetical protein